MPRSDASTAAKAMLATAPALPLAPTHWAALVEAMGLAPQEARTAELVLRGFAYKEIAVVMEIEPPTIRTYLARIEAKTKTRGRMELAMHVLALSHRVPCPPEKACRRK